MIGERIGNFNVVSQLGRGGMGEVYLGQHDKIGTHVAVKVLLPHISSSRDHVERFFNEAIAVGKIQHSGIGKIFDVGFHGERAYLVMEFLAGETLAARIRRLGKLPLAHVCELGRQICGVLEAVHKAGITHRDLKPDNIFIVPDEELPGGERVKIVDFGIAKLSGAGPGLTATGSGSMGTPAYMSPEQWKNSKTVDWRADAYSLGCLTFEMIAGRPPFIAETIGEACSLHLTEPPPQLATLVAVPAALDALVANLLAKLADQRPPSMRDIANAFSALAAAESLSAPAMALGATMPSTPPQVAPNMATQATSGGSVAQIANQPTVVAPPPALKPPTMSNTTLGGAASAQIPQQVRPKRKRWLIVALGGIAAALAVVVVVLAVRGNERGRTLTVSVECKGPRQWECLFTEARKLEAVAALPTARTALAQCLDADGCTAANRREIRSFIKDLEKETNARADVDIHVSDDNSGAGLGSSAIVGATGSGSSAIADATGSAAKDAADAVTDGLTRRLASPPKARPVEGTSGPKEGGPMTKLVITSTPPADISINGVDAGRSPINRMVPAGMYRVIARANGQERRTDVEIQAGAPVVNRAFHFKPPPVEPAPDPGVLPKFTPEIYKTVEPHYPKLVQCGKDHDSTGIQVNWNLKTNPDGTFSSITYDATRDSKPVSMSAAVVKCLTDVFKSLTFRRSTHGGGAQNGVALR